MNLDTNAAVLLFVLDSIPPTDANLYINPHLKRDELPVTGTSSVQPHPAIDELPTCDKVKLLYHINKVTGVHWLFIPPSVALNILAITYRKGHLGFSCCYKIMARSWFIHVLSKFLCSFIYHCSQCLTLQTNRHPSYESLQPMEFPPVFFFSLTLDFVLALSMTKKKFNAIMSVTCKFSKRITLIKGTNTWSADDWAHAFLKRLDLIDWSLQKQLITDHNPKFACKFWKTLFTKLEIKLLYSTAYHLQINGSSERTNQTIEIVLRFFVYAIEDFVRWPKVLPQIQSLLNNTSVSTTRKTPNEITYSFSMRKLLDLVLAVTVSKTSVVHINIPTQCHLLSLIRRNIMIESTNLYF